MPNTLVLSREQSIKVVLLWGKYEDIAKVRREFALCYGILKHLRKIPDLKVFQRVVNRFLETGSVEVAPVQRTKTTRNEKNVKEVNKLAKATTLFLQHGRF